MTSKQMIQEIVDRVLNNGWTSKLSYERQLRCFWFLFWLEDLTFYIKTLREYLDTHGLVYFATNFWSIGVEIYTENNKEATYLNVFLPDQVDDEAVPFFESKGRALCPEKDGYIYFTVWPANSGWHLFPMYDVAVTFHRNNSPITHEYTVGMFGGMKFVKEKAEQAI